MKLQSLVVAVVAALSAATCSMAFAQGTYYQGRSDNPNGPTVSPYLNLLQNNSGGVTNYQSLVKPLINQNSAIQRQGSALQRQGGAIQQLQRQAYQGPVSGAGTGHITFFMNYSHYYPQR